MKTLPTVMLVGIGHLGGPVLDELARSSQIGRVVALSRHEGRGRARCNLASLSATTRGAMTVVEHRVVDIAAPEQLRDAIVSVAPDAIVHTASMQTWWLPDLFPEQPRRALRRAGFGAWLPLHLVLALRVAADVSAAGYRGIVVNASYPDVVNVVLSRVGLPVTAGVGNVDELVAKVRMRLARKLGAAPGELDVWLVAHHALQSSAFAAANVETSSDSASVTPATSPVETPPFYLRVERDGRDITDESAAVSELLAPCPLPSGPGWGTFTAASTRRLVEALLANIPSHLHVPGPEGLPGGYPVCVAHGGVTVCTIPGITREEAISLNERSHPFDGIDRIEPDGTVLFTADATAAMSETLGYDCVELSPAAVPGRAAELGGRFAAYAERYGIDLTGAGRGFSNR